MTPPTNLMNDIDRIFGQEQPEVARVCMAIVSFLVAQPPSKHLHLTYSSLKTAALPRSDSDLLAAIQFLTGAKAGMLQMKYEFVDEQGEYHPVSRSELAAAERGEGFWHPETGEAVNKYRDQILIYFTPTDEARNYAMREA